MKNVIVTLQQASSTFLNITIFLAVKSLSYCIFYLHCNSSSSSCPVALKLVFFSLLWFSLVPSQACRDRGWTSAAAVVDLRHTCVVKSACYVFPSAAWWRQTLSTWWCSVWWLSTQSVWPSSTTTSPTGWPSSSVGFTSYSYFICLIIFWLTAWRII